MLPRVAAAAEAEAEADAAAAAAAAATLGIQMDDSGCLDFPSFEPYDAEDRPPPPPVEDYPIGCEVDLVDIEPAKLAQTSELWQPFMDTLFGQCKRSVRVVRHQGDYTFVVCNLDPELVVGCTLYRACLGEPKVRFKKYMPGHTMEGAATSLPGSTDSIDKCRLFEAHTANDEAETCGLQPPFPSAPAVIGSDPLGTCVVYTSRNAEPSETHRIHRTTESFLGEKPATAEEENTRRLKYNYATKMAYEALVRQNYMEAVRYYTKALKYSRDGGARSLSNRSVAFLGLRNVDAAFKDALRVIELTPNSFVGYVRAGNTLRGMRRFEEARTYYEKALAVEPQNDELRYLLSSNYVMMLYASAVEHRSVASIVLDRSMMNVFLTAKRGLKAGELAWVESTMTLTLLGKRPSSNFGMSSTSAADVGPSSYICGQCYRPLTQARHFCDSMPGIEPSLIYKLHRDGIVVQCNGHCGEMYCSEACRTKAWASHHWVECASHGKWSEAFRHIPVLFENFAVEYNKSVSGRKRQDVVVHDDRETGTLPLLNDSADVIVASVRVACRMFAEIVSNGRALEDAAHTFDWLLPKESEYVKCLNARSMDILTMITIEKILKPVYTLLQKCFTLEEQRYLSFASFLHCYERTRFNGVKVRVSRWPGIQEKAESYIGLFKVRESENSTALHQCAFSEDVTHAGSDSSQIAQLKRIIETPAELVVGYFECFAVFRVFSATFATRGLQGKGQEHYNARVRPSIQPAAVIQIDAVEKIPKGDRIQVDRSTTALLV